MSSAAIIHTDSAARPPSVRTVLKFGLYLIFASAIAGALIGAIGRFAVYLFSLAS